VKSSQDFATLGEERPYNMVLERSAPFPNRAKERANVIPFHCG
jgi:hypothetical protein